MNKKNIVYGLFMILIIITVGIAGCVTANDQRIGGDKDEHGCLIAAGYSWCEAKQKCIRAWEENCTGEVALANPASVNCINNGGKLDIVTAEDGSQSGMCTLKDGVVCEEWAYFKGECPPQRHICTDEEKKAEACTMEYLPVCGDNGVTYGNACSACASNNITLWTHGKCPSG
jgi:putative hemolysin